MPAAELAIDGLREEVGRILGAMVIAEFVVAGPNPLLHPKLPDCKVADLADARPAAYSDCGTAVNEDRQADVDAQVLRDRGQA